MGLLSSIPHGTCNLHKLCLCRATICTDYVITFAASSEWNTVICKNVKLFYSIYNYKYDVIDKSDNAIEPINDIMCNPSKNMISLILKHHQQERMFQSL